MKSEGRKRMDRNQWQWLIALAVALLSGCSSETPADSETSGITMPGTIVIDDAHNVATGNATGYSISESTAVVLDATGYTYDDGLLTAPVNALHVAVGGGGKDGSRYYRVEWDGTGTVTLSPETLDAVDGPAFGGFRSGRNYIIAIGHESPPESGETLPFAPAWVGTVAVQ